MRRGVNLRTVLPLALAIGLTALFLGHLASPGVLLAVRDIVPFHLPLRTAATHLADPVFPQWNPMLHGGQPLLSNPNYAAFYPPGWLALFLPPAYVIDLLLLLHALWGFLGAQKLARLLGCRQGTSLLAAIAFAFGGATLSTTNLLTTYCGLAWLPWILIGCERWFSAPESRVLSLLALAPALAFAMQFLAGEPVVVLTTILAAGWLALAQPGARAKSLSRLAVIGTIALLLASAQLLPTWQRVTDGARGAGLDPEAVLQWSAPPWRAAEFFWPRLWGDPMRIEEGLYFGWGLHDRQFPYVVSIYPGQLVALLGVAALLLWRIPRRTAWLGMVGTGLLLSAGSYLPGGAKLLASMPLFSQIRYPEKFLLLTTTALVFAAALGWDHLLAYRRREGPARDDFPLALATTVLAVSATVAAVLWLRPELSSWLVRSRLPVEPSPERLVTAITFLRGEALVALLAGVCSVAILGLHRWRRAPIQLLIPLTLTFVIGDLYYYHHNLTPTIDLVDLTQPPAPLDQLDPRAGRLFNDYASAPPDTGVLTRDARGPATLWNQVARAHPYTAALWGFQYALHEDHDLMLTEPARAALELFRLSWPDPERARRHLGAWSVRYLLWNRPAPEVLQNRLEGHPDVRLTVEENPCFRPVYRIEPAVQIHPTWEHALQATIASDLAIPHWTGESGRGGTIATAGPARILRVQERADTVRIRYRTDTPAPLTVTQTYDRNWSAEIGGDEAVIHRGGLGTMGLVLPAGEHELTLRYRDPWVTRGLVVSITTLVVLLVAATASSLRSRHLA